MRGKIVKTGKSIQYALLQKVAVESDVFMTEVELHKQYSKLSGGGGKEVLTWKNIPHLTNDREMKEKENH